VRCEGETHAIAAEDLVPGDIVLLEADDRMPADGRLFIAAGLEIDKSALRDGPYTCGIHIVC
jgi:Ca2+-transporting ATPase